MNGQMEQPPCWVGPVVHPATADQRGIMILRTANEVNKLLKSITEKINEVCNIYSAWLAAQHHGPRCANGRARDMASLAPP